ncbi:MAG: homoserine kinase [Alteromonadaceae bacterium]|jgi:homoserine kinase
MTCSVYAPASIGNVGVGFDLLGAAVSPIDGSLLGDVVSIVATDPDDFQLSLTGPYKTSLPEDRRSNVVYQCCHYFRNALQKTGLSVAFLSLNLEKNLPVGSGLGSSATSIVATLHALNVYFELPFSARELLTMMGHFEGQISGSVHYDNVAPCYLGGLQLMTGDDDICQSLPVPSDWYWVMAYSGVNVSTKMAREVLPKQLDLATGIEYARNLAVFVDSLHRQDWSKAAASVNDPVAEPHRKGLLPGFNQATQKLTEAGVLTCGISGSGPTLFAIADTLEKAQQFKQILDDNYIQNVNGFCTICHIDLQGTRVIESVETAKEVNQ